MKFRWETEFKETEIGEIPKDWDVKALGVFIKRIVKGKVPKKPKNRANKQDSDDLCPYLSVEYLRGEKEETEYFPCSWGVQVKESDILIIWDGAANAGEIIEAKHGILGSTLALLDVDTEKANRFFFYYVLKFFENELKSLRSGTDDRHVDKQALLDFLIPYPPLEEQTRIATVLSWFDDLIENKKKQNEILEKTAMAIFKSWFIDFEPFQNEEFVYSEELDMEIPKGWEVKELKNMAEVIMGQSPSSKYYNQEEKGIPFIQGKGQFGQYTPYPDIYSTQISKLAKSLDILVTVRAPVGELNIADREYVIGRGVAALRSEFWAFLYVYLKTYNEVLKSFERGTTFDAITKPELESIKILLPPQPILQRFHSLVEPLFQKILLNQKQILTLKKIRDTLLPQLVFGRLRVEEL